MAYRKPLIIRITKAGNREIMAAQKIQSAIPFMISLGNDMNI